MNNICFIQKFFNIFRIDNVLINKINIPVF